MYPESSRSLDSLRHMRLLAPLRDMIDDGGKAKAAKALGVNYRTVSKAVGAGTLTDRMSDALERHLLLGGGSAAAQQRDRVDALVERVDCYGKGAARRTRSRRGRGQGVQGGPRKVDAARGAADGAAGGGKERVRDSLSDRSRGLSQGRSEGTFAQGRIPSW